MLSQEKLVFDETDELAFSNQIFKKLPGSFTEALKYPFKK